jgi:small subunit ribosomal protein S6
MTAPRTYELVYIVHPEATEEQVTGLHDQVAAIVGRFSGTIESTENWGRKRLAYEVGHQKEGIYVVELMRGPSEMIRELDRRLKVIDQVLRHLVVRVDEEMEIAERRRTERLEERARRRVARGLPPEPEPTPAPEAEATLPEGVAADSDHADQDTTQAEG